MDTLNRRSQNTGHLELQTTHLINQHGMKAAPVIDLEGRACPLLQRSISRHSAELLKIADDAGMAIGITDPHGTLLWTWSSAPMLRSAEDVHFLQGGQWSTQAVGTNAIGIALNTQRSSCVYSHENQMDSVRDWVCYATPIIDPISGQFHGIINLSTKYNKHTPLGVLAVERCAELVQHTIQREQNNVLYLKVLGTPLVQFNHQTLNLTLRQIEILSILALNPQGISLDDLHYALYGERDISIKTLKSELSQLRTLLADCISSRPYRLCCEIQSDFMDADQALNAGFLASTFSLYKGSFLSKSSSPLLSTWRNCFDARLSHLIYQMQDVDQLLKLVGRLPERIDAIQRLLELLPKESPMYINLEQKLYST